MWIEGYGRSASPSGSRVRAPRVGSYLRHLDCFESARRVRRMKPVTRAE
jgi:hypothetical protein